MYVRACVYMHVCSMDMHAYMSMYNTCTERKALKNVIQILDFIDKVHKANSRNRTLRIKGCMLNIDT